MSEDSSNGDILKGYRLQQSYIKSYTLTHNKYKSYEICNFVTFQKNEFQLWIIFESRSARI